MKAYIKVKCSDELPKEKTPVYVSIDNEMKHVAFLQDGKWWEAWDEYALSNPIYWLKEVTIPDEEEIKQAAKNNADAIDRRVCSYWNGLFEGYQMGQRDLLSKLK